MLLSQQHRQLSVEPGHQSVAASWVLTKEGGSWTEGGKKGEREVIGKNEGRKGRREGMREGEREGGKGRSEGRREEEREGGRERGKREREGEGGW